MNPFFILLIMASLILKTSLKKENSDKEAMEKSIGNNTIFLESLLSSDRLPVEGSSDV